MTADKRTHKDSLLRLSCPTQAYDWGKLGSSSQVALLASAGSSLKVDANKPYAELWMGTHPNGPASLSSDASVSLKSLLSPANLSPSLHAQFNGDLPFLFKVLSIRKALSIQAHPDKALAEWLFAQFPKVYKDPNHKPEMAIGLTEFEALIGFRPIQEIQSHLTEFPEFKALLGPAVSESFASLSSTAPETDRKTSLKSLFKTLMESDEKAVQEHLSALLERIATHKDMFSQLVLRIAKQYPGDVGVFCLLLLNYIVLKPGQAIFLAANEPHAYLSGDCIECMAASDNVVRSGLTPKFKDVDTLVNMLTYNHGPADAQILSGVPFKGSKVTTLYDPPIREFAVLKTELSVATEKEDVTKGLNGPSVLIVTGGEGSIQVVDTTTGKKEGSDTDDEESLVTGSVFFVGAGVSVLLKAGQEGSLTVYRAFCE